VTYEWTYSGSKPCCEFKEPFGQERGTRRNWDCLEIGLETTFQDDGVVKDRGLRLGKAGSSFLQIYAILGQGWKVEGLRLEC
jgi:hypothetical protein